MTIELTMLAADLLDWCKNHKLRLAVAESCTGGLICTVITENAGSSDVFERGFITYSNPSKSEVLGVPAELLRKHGAVSKEVAIAMAEGARKTAKVDIALSVTGIAGPGGGSKEKPVGLVHLAASTRGRTLHAVHQYAGDRSAIRKQACAEALKLGRCCLLPG
ncbi:MAG: CinA family protein [Geminicoccaceae bacterium]